jgi:hypothetical protein
VLAHEFAHDLDWQAAKRVYGTLVGYRTDHAVRQHSDWLAGALRRMASASRSEATGRDQALERPTEIFARNVDWFVGAALSRDGRMNGYLSAVQDPVLTGYASATTPEAVHDAGEATLRALEGIATLTPDVRDWFDDRYGAGRRASVHEAVRRVLEAPVATTDVRQADPSSIYAGDATAALMRSVPAASSAWECLLDSYADRSADPAATKAAMLLAAEARARGVVRRWAMLLDRYGSSGPWRWRALAGAPWDATVQDATERELRDAILWRALRGDASGTPPFAVSSSALTRCK